MKLRNKPYAPKWEQEERKEIMSSGFDDWIYWYFFAITLNYNSPQSMTV
jgi:hypothetical protein